MALFVLMALCLSAAALYSGARAAAGQFEASLGGYFKLESDPGYTGGVQRPVTGPLIEQIGGLPGVGACNRMALEYLLVPGLRLAPGRFSAQGDPRARLARFLGNSDSSLHEYFLLHSFTLAQGRHIAPGERGKALVSQQLAARNGLAVGDLITAQTYPGAQEGAGAETYRLEIVGIFAVGAAVQSGALEAECDLAENFIFADLGTVLAAQAAREPQAAGNYRQATFFARDPKQLGQLVGQAQELLGAEGAFRLTVNDKAQRAATAPLQKLQWGAGVFLLLLVLFGAALLTLILRLWMRDRAREAGLLFALGVGRGPLVGQRLAEVFALLVPALLLAFFVSGLVAGTAAAAVLQAAPRQESPVAEARPQQFAEPPGLAQPDIGGAVRAAVGAGELLFAAGCGGLISLAAVGLSSAGLLRAKPKELLSSFY